MLAKTDNISSVVVLVLDRNLGNLVVCLSSIVALVEYFQGKKCYLAIDSAYKEVVESVKGLDRIIYYPRREIKRSNLLREAMLFLRFIQQIRTTHSDVLIDFQGGNTSSLVTLLSGASYRISNSAARKPYVYNAKIDLPVGKHKVQSYTEIVLAIGAHVEDTNFRLHASELRRDSLESTLGLHGITANKPIVSIHAGAGIIQRQWTTEGFVEVADWLSGRGYQVIFVGAGRDLDKIHAVMSAVNLKAYNLGDKLSLGELMALFEMSSLFLGNDSGPMHLAAAIGTPVVALFGPGDDRRWGPLSPNSIVLRGQERCEDCRIKRKDCDNFPCITLLSPKKVKEVIGELLAE
jgi:ADP-heptose:LPS heptosyltransferase